MSITRGNSGIWLLVTKESINIWDRTALSLGNLDIEDARMASEDIYSIMKKVFSGKTSCEEQKVSER
jgi:hypothetical protein